MALTLFSVTFVAPYQISSVCSLDNISKSMLLYFARVPGGNCELLGRAAEHRSAWLERLTLVNWG